MKIPLLEYLDKLEATAKLVALGSLVSEDTENQLRQYFLATQPEATLALIAKLREAVSFLDEIEVASFDGAVSKRLADLKTIEVPE